MAQEHDTGRPQALLAWSSGKDAAWALHVLREQGAVEVVGLLTTLVEETHRVAVHAVPEALLDAQAAAVGLPLTKVRLPDPCPNAVYERILRAHAVQARAEGVTALVFGDLFLEDVRRYREGALAGTGLDLLFPLWGRDTARLAREMVAAGLRAYLTTVDTQRLDASFAGRRFDDRLLAELPPAVDPCGERGEFHTFVYAGPMMRRPLAVRCGDRYTQGGFAHVELLREGAGS